VNGDDYLSGDAGDDVITGGDGIDRMLGGDGNDTFYARDGLQDNGIFGGAGYDKAQIDSTDDDDPNNYSSIEELIP
jgi:Ca2+-binding RTX toxin-like protein